jgi:NADH-quinone oxidoreductase subunit J
MLPQVVPEMTDVGTVEVIGEALYSEYILPFHIVGLLLTAAASGAILIAEHKVNPLSQNDD